MCVWHVVCGGHMCVWHDEWVVTCVSGMWYMNEWVVTCVWHVVYG